MTKQEFFALDGRPAFFNNAFAVADYVQKNCPQQAEEIIAAADEIAAQRFMFTLRWDMERTWQPVEFKDEINWIYQPGDDPEWVFAFSRMRFWICLGQAYALTKNEKYAKAFATQLVSWIDTVPQQDDKNALAWRSIEVGLRLEYWLKAMRYFENSPAITDAVMGKFTTSVIEHAEFIMQVWNPYNLLSNWGVLANHGLFLAGTMLPQTARTKEYTATATDRLAREIKTQVYRDGSHWEQSPMYHNEVLHCYLDVILLAQRAGIALPNIILQQTKAMCYVDIYSGKPDHNELSMGDSDEIDQRDLISKGAYLFADTTLKARGYAQPDFDTAWDIGEQGIAAYAQLGTTLPESTDKAFSDSGNFYMRSGWDTQDTYVHLHCGTLGAGHGHADQLHIDLFSRGEDILLDAGRYTYVMAQGREDFKAADAHNIVLVNDLPYYKCKDSWECFDLTRSLNQKFYTENAYGYMEGAHLAYQNLPEGGVLVNRQVIFLKPDIIVVADSLYTAGTHNYSALWHFNNAGKLTGNGNCYAYNSQKLTAQVCITANNLQTTIQASKLSRHYNHYEESSMLKAGWQGKGFSSAFTVFALSDAGTAPNFSVEKLPVESCFKQGLIFPDAQIEALNIRFGNAHYTLVMAHQEYATPTDLFRADGCIGFGSVVVFNRAENETETGTVLLW